MDADGDGVPDSEDDHPTEPSFISKLRITKIAKYWSGGRVMIFFEYENDKPHNLEWIQPYATLKRADGTVSGTYASQWDVDEIIFKPGERCYAFVERYDYERLTAIVEPEVKAGPVQPETRELEVEIVSHRGKFEEVSGYLTYKVLGSSKIKVGK